MCSEMARRRLSEAGRAVPSESPPPGSDKTRECGSFGQTSFPLTNDLAFMGNPMTRGDRSSDRASPHYLATLFGRVPFWPTCRVLSRKVACGYYSNPNQQQ